MAHKRNSNGVDEIFKLDKMQTQTNTNITSTQHEKKEGKTTQADPSPKS